MLHRDAGVGVGNQAAFTELPGLEISVGCQVNLPEIFACRFGVEVAPHAAGDQTLQWVEQRIVAFGQGCAVDDGLAAGQLIRQHPQHRGDHLAVRRHCGGDRAGHVLVRAADFDETGFLRARAAVMVVILALAEPAFARAAAHIAIARVAGRQIQADHQTGRVDQVVEGLAASWRQQEVVQVIALLVGRQTGQPFKHQHELLGAADRPALTSKVEDNADFCRKR